METLTPFFPHLDLSPGTWQWLQICFAAIALTALLKLSLRLISTRLRRYTAKTTSIWDDVGVDILDGLKTFVILAWLVYLLARPIAAGHGVHKVLVTWVVVSSVFQAGLWGLHLIRSWRDSFLQKRIHQDPSAAAALGLLYIVVQAVFLTTLATIGISNLGIDVGALVAGLGVGGIAVALAAQNILGDLLASLSIVLDKPFVVGDFIVVGTEMGTVEQIGVKTTRVRSLSGEQLVFPNKDLLESRVHNYKRMWQRRVVQTFGVALTTSADQLEKIPAWVQAFCGKYGKLRFDRCHFKGFGNCSLDFEFVFWVLDPDYNIYMDYQQSLLMDIFRKFDQEQIKLAVPTRQISVVPPLPT
jgi:small-conductance mechanosensitive channel